MGALKLGVYGVRMNETENRPVPAPVAGGNPGVREDILHYDPLLDCLVELSRFHGRPQTRAALTAGLPLEKGSLTPSLFARAASRAGLSAKVVRRPLDHIDPALLPVVLLTAGDEACVLLGWNETGDVARLLFPETGQGSVQLSRDELARRYIGVAIFARPHFRFDKRTPEVGDVKLRHWFWGALSDQWPVYRDVLSAALLINVIALAMPLFTMNVYDRVIPNRAMETLWVLALGVILLFAVDFMLRLLRGYFIDLASARIDMQLSAQIMDRVLGVRMEARPAAVGAFASNLRSFEAVRDFITSASVTAFIDLPFALLFVFVIALIAWQLVLPVLLAIVIVVIYAYDAAAQDARTFRDHLPRRGAAQCDADRKPDVARNDQDPGRRERHAVEVGKVGGLRRSRRTTRCVSSRPRRPMGRWRRNNWSMSSSSSAGFT